MSGLVAACPSNVGLALLDQVATESLWYDAPFMEVGHELPRDLQTQARIMSEYL